MENSRPKKSDGTDSSATNGVACKYCGNLVRNPMYVCGCPQSMDANGRQEIRDSIAVPSETTHRNSIQDQVKEVVSHKLRKILEHDMKRIMDEAMHTTLREVSDRLTVILLTKDGENFKVKFEWKTDEPINPKAR